VAEKRNYIPYTFELGQKICKLITEGISPSKIEKMEGMPSRSSIIKWSRDTEGKPDYCKAYTDAYKVLVNLWIEERDELSDVIVVPLTPDEVIEKYDLSSAEENSVIMNYMRTDVATREKQLKNRLDALTKNIGQIAHIFDERFIEQKRVENTGSITHDIPALTMVDYGKLQNNEPKAIEGEVIHEPVNKED